MVCLMNILIRRSSPLGGCPSDRANATTLKNIAEVAIVRVHEDKGRRSGDYRVLVDRLWPRGVKKSFLDIDVWIKDIAPSTELRQWFGHQSDRFAEFSRRYDQELAGPPAREALAELLRNAAPHPRLVLMTATRDIEHSAAAVLREKLRRSAPR
jgi:uncharacterized protein YeaO (DUF488 family)